MDLHESLSLLINLCIGAGLAFIVELFYKKYSLSPTKKESFSTVFPLLTLSIIVVIFVVKSSLALSLGLVGALSIVRFRTPIKDPEELVYLFICIALGLTLGAGHRVYAIISVGFILFVIFIRIQFHNRKPDYNMLVTITDTSDAFFNDEDSLLDFIQSKLDKKLVHQFQSDENETQLSLIVSSSVQPTLENMIIELKKKSPSASVNYLNLNGFQ